jgi:Tol biopolymer transport system component
MTKKKPTDRNINITIQGNVTGSNLVVGDENQESLGVTSAKPASHHTPNDVLPPIHSRDGSENGLEKLLQFASSYFSEYFNIFFATLTKPDLYFPSIEENMAKSELSAITLSKRYKLNPHLLPFVIFNTAIGAVLFLLTPNISSDNFNFVFSSVFALVLWTIYSLLAYYISKLLGGTGAFLDTVSFCFQVFSTIAVIGNLTILCNGILLDINLFSSLLSHSNDFFSWLLEKPIITGRVIKTILALIYLPVGIKKIHQIQNVNLAFSTVVVFLSMVFCNTTLSLMQNQDNFFAGAAAGAQETMIAQELSATPATKRTSTPSSTVLPQLKGSIAYISGGTELVIANMNDGSQPTAIIHDGAEKNSLIWSPNGKQIAFAANVNDNWDVYVVNVNDGIVTRLTDNPAKDWLPSWSPDGSQVVFESFRDGDFELYRIDQDGGNLFRLTNSPFGDARPAWSPDGQWIAFVSNRDGSSEIYRMDSDGNNVQRLTVDTTPDVGPSWSPDSQWIAFTSWRDGNSEIYRMKADGSAQQRLTANNVRDDYPLWSPDGQRILHISGDKSAEAENVIVMNSDGSSARALTAAPGNNGSPSWSPDSCYIAFQTNRPGMNEVYVMNLNGEIIKQISIPGQNASQPTWKP